MIFYFVLPLVLITSIARGHIQGFMFYLVFLYMPIKLSTPLSTVKFKECFLLFSPKISRFSGDWSKSDIAIDKRPLKFLRHWKQQQGVHDARLPLLSRIWLPYATAEDICQ